jgi:RNase P/RNase MRP subunit p30
MNDFPTLFNLTEVKFLPRRFVDYIVPENFSDLRSMLEIDLLLGYSQVWIGYDQLPHNADISKLIEEYPIEIITRLDIDGEAKTKNQIITILRKQRRNTTLIAIKCYDPELTGWAAQDNRVDILKFPINQIGKLFTNSVAKLMIKFDKHLELSLANVYLSPEKFQIQIVRQIKQAMAIASRKKVSIIINSGSARINHLRSPWELISLIETISSSKVSQIDSLSKIPDKLVSKNKVKISSDYIAPGVFRVTESSKMILEEEE